MNIELNFVHNSNMSLSHYRLALECFEKMLRVKPDHAITWYYPAACLDHLVDNVERDRYLVRAIECANSMPFWKDYIAMFQIPFHFRAFGTENPHV